MKSPVDEYVAYNDRLESVETEYKQKLNLLEQDRKTKICEIGKDHRGRLSNKMLLNYLEDIVGSGSDKKPPLGRIGEIIHFDMTADLVGDDEDRYFGKNYKVYNCTWNKRLKNHSLADYSYLVHRHGTNYYVWNPKKNIGDKEKVDVELYVKSGKYSIWFPMVMWFKNMKVEVLKVEQDYLLVRTNRVKISGMTGEIYGGESFTFPIDRLDLEAFIKSKTGLVNQ